MRTEVHNSELNKVAIVESLGKGFVVKLKEGRSRYPITFTYNGDNAEAMALRKANELAEVDKRIWTV